MSELAEAIALLVRLFNRLAVVSVVWLALLTIAVALLYYDRKQK